MITGISQSFPAPVDSQRLTSTGQTLKRSQIAQSQPEPKPQPPIIVRQPVTPPMPLPTPLAVKGESVTAVDVQG